MTPKANPNHYPHHHLVAIDIAKDTLQVQDSGGAAFQVSNDPAGLRRLCKHLEGTENPLVVCEATGGYERTLLAVLHQAQIPLALVNPARVRDFARSEGQKAKTDPIDARLILRFAQSKALTATPAPDPATAELAALLDRRSHLTEAVAREKNRIQNCSRFIEGSIKRMQRCIEKELALIERQIQKLVASTPLLETRAAVLQEVKGVGQVTAWSILAYLSEASHLDRNKLVALAGLAPFNRDSGRFRGQRHIFAGRAKVRKCLYMAAQTAAIHNPVIKPYVQRLIARGKPYKCAIVAAMRKLLLHIQSILKTQQRALA